MTSAPPLHRTIGGLGLATIVSYGGWFYGFGVLVQPISDDTGWSIGTLGAAYAAAQLLSGLAAAGGGRVLDRRGGRRAFTVGALVGAPLLAVAAVATSAAVFVVTFALGGAVIGATGFYHVTMAAARRVVPDEPARPIALLTIWGAFASPIFLPITAWLVGATSWRVTLGVLAATTALGMLVAAALAPGGRASTPGEDEDPLEELPLQEAARRAWSDPAARRLLVMVVGNGVGTGLLLTYQVPMMVAFGLPLATAASVAGARGFLQLTGRVGLSRIVDRFGARRCLAAAMALSIVAAGLMAGSGTIAVALLFALVAGAAMGAKSPLTGIHAAAILPERHLGALMGVVQALAGAATAAGPLAGGLLYDARGSYVPSLVLAAVGFAVAGVAVAGGSLPPEKPTNVIEDGAHPPTVAA